MNPEMLIQHCLIGELLPTDAALILLNVFAFSRRQLQHLRQLFDRLMVVAIVLLQILFRIHDVVVVDEVLRQRRLNHEALAALHALIRSLDVPVLEYVLVERIPPLLFVIAQPAPVHAVEHNGLLRLQLLLAVAVHIRLLRLGHRHAFALLPRRLLGRLGLAFGLRVPAGLVAGGAQSHLDRRLDLHPGHHHHRFAVLAVPLVGGLLLFQDHLVAQQAGELLRLDEVDVVALGAARLDVGLVVRYVLVALRAPHRVELQVLALDAKGVGADLPRYDDHVAQHAVVVHVFDDFDPLAQP